MVSTMASVYGALSRFTGLFILMLSVGIVNILEYFSFPIRFFARIALSQKLMFNKHNDLGAFEYLMGMALSVGWAAIVLVVSMNTIVDSFKVVNFVSDGWIEYLATPITISVALIVFIALSSVRIGDWFVGLYVGLLLFAPVLLQIKLVILVGFLMFSICAFQLRLALYIFNFIGGILGTFFVLAMLLVFLVFMCVDLYRWDKSTSVDFVFSYLNITNVWDSKYLIAIPASLVLVLTLDYFKMKIINKLKK